MVTGLSLIDYQDMLKMFWSGVERYKMYEYDLMHGINCLCCSRILQSSNDPGRGKPKAKAKLGRKPGGHNKK
jgi:hypothetical protein